MLVCSKMPFKTRTSLISVWETAPLPFTCVCITSLGNRWHQDALWEECGQQREGDALGNVLLQNRTLTEQVLPFNVDFTLTTVQTFSQMA